MTRVIIQFLLTALAFAFILPLINGIDFHGNFVAALGLALVFGIMVWLVDFLAVALTAVLTIGSFGTALLWLIPIWILGFWLLPAVALKLVSDIMPGYLTIVGWVPAIIGGLIMMVIGMLTSATWDSRRTAS